MLHTWVRVHTITVVGNTIVMEIKNETEQIKAADELSKFGAAMGLLLDVEQAQQAVTDNKAKAKPYWDAQKLQSSIIAKAEGSGMEAAPVKPLIVGETYIDEGLEITIKANITGTAPITIDVDWGDEQTDAAVTLPKEHTYAEAGEYTVTITATNAAGKTTVTLDVVVEDE